MATLSLTKEQIRVVKSEAVRGKPYAHRISIALAFRLLGISSPSADPFAVLDEVDYLEGLSHRSRTKGESQFMRPPLAPLWHKHFSTARMLPRNIAIRWNLKDGGNRDLSRLLSRIAAESGDNPDVWPDQLAHELVIRGYEDRCQRGLTGDWIIYGKHNAENYYLDLATHEDGNGESARLLYEKLRGGCCAEFPFLFERETE